MIRTRRTRTEGVGILHLNMILTRKLAERLVSLLCSCESKCIRDNNSLSFKDFELHVISVQTLHLQEISVTSCWVYSGGSFKVGVPGMLDR